MSASRPNRGIEGLPQLALRYYTEGKFTHTTPEKKRGGSVLPQWQTNAPGVQFSPSSHLNDNIEAFKSEVEARSRSHRIVCLHSPCAHAPTCTYTTCQPRLV